MRIARRNATVRTALLSVSAVLFASSAASAGSDRDETEQKDTSAPFEGAVTMQVATQATKGPQHVSVRIKGNRVRYDLPPTSNARHEPLEAIVDMGRHEVFLVMPAQKSFAVIDLSQIAPQSKQAAQQRIGSAATQWTASPTGTTEELAGHACNEWQAAGTQSNVKIDACLAPDVRVDFASILPAALLPPSWAAKLRNGELPLRTTVYDANGKQTFHEEVTGIVPGPVADSDFQPPAGFHRVDLPVSAFGNLLPSAR